MRAMSPNSGLNTAPRTSETYEPDSLVTADCTQGFSDAFTFLLTTPYRLCTRRPTLSTLVR